MRATLKSGARKVRCTGLIDERSMNGEMRIWTRVGEIENKGEKSEVQGDLQIPSSLVALAPLFLSLSLALISLLSFRGLFLIFLKESRRETYTRYTCVHTCICMCMYSFAIAAWWRATKKRFLRLFLHCESWRSRTVLCVEIASHSDKSAFDNYYLYRR